MAGSRLQGLGTDVWLDPTPHVTQPVQLVADHLPECAESSCPGDGAAALLSVCPLGLVGLGCEEVKGPVASLGWFPSQ